MDVAQVGDAVAKSLLVVHAISGCDTTSALFGHGKKGVLKVLTKSKEIMSLAQRFGADDVTNDEAIDLGKQLLAVIYGGKPTDNLNGMRHNIYCHLTSTATRAVQPERLPPTENSAKFHSLRTHLQVLQWKTLMSCNANPEEWGWKKSDDDTYLPIATDIEPAPEDILNFVRCKCRQACVTLQCSCRKHGLECVSACKHCHGSSCDNAKSAENLLTSDDDDDAAATCVAEPLPEGDFDDNIEYFIPWVNE